MPPKVPDTARIVGRNLKNIRKIKGMTQKEMGFLLGVTFQQMQKYENGQNRLPLDKLYIIKHALGAPYESFFLGLPLETPACVLQKIDLSEMVMMALREADNPQLKRKIVKIIEILLS